MGLSRIDPTPPESPKGSSTTELMAGALLDSWSASGGQKIATLSKDFSVEPMLITASKHNSTPKAGAMDNRREFSSSRTR